MEPRDLKLAVLQLMAAAALTLLPLYAAQASSSASLRDVEDSNALIMTAEIALQRDDCGRAAANYTIAAQRLTDAKLAERAAGVALDCGQYQAAERAAAAEGRIRRFREESRASRIEIAREAEHRFRRKVSWGVTCADVTEMFTTLSVPVMTRLRQPERRVLDTLVEAGVARSRSDALAWCVRLTGENADAWLARLRTALRQVQEVRDQGPGSA